MDFFDFVVLVSSLTGGITDIQPAVSINDAGRIAFVGVTATGQAVFVCDAGGAPKIVSFPTPSATRTYGSEIQINNAGKVAAVDISGGQQRLIRLWDSNSPGANTIISRGSTPQLDPTHFDSLGAFPSVNNAGQVIFAGLISPASGPANWSIHASAAVVPRSDTASRITTLESNSFFRPVIGPGGLMVLGSKLGTAKKIVAGAPGGTPFTLAATGPNWTDLGVRPSISDDGLAIVFYGDLTAEGAKTLTTLNSDLVPMPLRPGPGIFASITLGSSPAGSRATIRLAGVSGNGELDPGERMPLPPGTIELGPDFNYDGAADWGLSWDPALVDARIGISNFATTTAGSSTTSAFASYLALDSVNGSAKSVFRSRINVVRDAGGNLLSAGAESPIRALRTGDTVASLPVSDLALHDSVNGAGQTAIWIKSGTKTAVVRADPNTRILADRVGSTGLAPAFIATINSRARFAPDSPLVDQVVPGVAATAARTGFNQIIVHATVSNEPGGLRTLSEVAIPGIHYLVSRQGRVTQILSEDSGANHAPPTNPVSIGIELVDDHNGTVGSGTGHRENNDWLTPVQMRKAARLVHDIAKRRGIPLTHPAVMPSTLHPASEGNRPAGTAFNNQGDANYHQSNQTPARDGYNANFRGILAHGQILNRTTGKDDPRIFNWPAFEAVFVPPVVLRVDQ